MGQIKLRNILTEDVNSDMVNIINDRLNKMGFSKIKVKNSDITKSDWSYIYVDKTYSVRSIENIPTIDSVNYTITLSMLKKQPPIKLVGGILVDITITFSDKSTHRHAIQHSYQNSKWAVVKR